MSPAKFRTVMVCVAIVALTLFGILLFVLLQKKPSCAKSCPVVRCGVRDVTRSTAAISSESRDRKVVNDQLYPPLNRSEERVHLMTQNAVQQGKLYTNLQGSDDSFRLVGYLTNHELAKDAGGNLWKVFARMKDRHQGEFYIVPSNNNIDVKIALTPEIMTGERLRDLYTIPKEMRFKSPMLNTGVYEFTELPKADLGDLRYA